MIDQFKLISLELLLAVLAIGVLSLRLLIRGIGPRLEVGVVGFGLGGLLILTLSGAIPNGLGFGRVFLNSDAVLAFKALFVLSGFLVTLLCWPFEGEGNKPLLPPKYNAEALALMLVSVLGMCIIVSARELVLLYVGLEMVSLPLVILTAFNTKDHRSSEAGMKYVVYSALSSGLLLYGLSMVYGMAGSTYLDIISQRLTLSWLSILSSVFILSGVGFKVAAVPFHIWTLDVYEGAPIPVTAFLSVASKAAGLALLYKIVIQPFGEVIFSWQLLVAILATLTMTFGNLAALHQNNMKRFLACSSIAQAGYILVGMVNPEPFGRAAVIYYLLVYIISNIAAFGAVIAIANATGREDMRDYVGLSISNPKLALVFMLAMFSLAGIPPLAGFIGKFYLFAAAAKLGMYWLVLVGTINATISLYYYLMVVKWAYLVKPDAHASPLQVFNIPFVHRFVLFVVTVGMVLVGIVPHFIRWAQVVAGSAL